MNFKQNDYNTKPYLDAYEVAYSNAYNSTYAAETEKLTKKLKQGESLTAEQVESVNQKALEAASKVKVPDRNMPDYNGVSSTKATSYTHKFSQFVFEASINVEF